MKKIRLNEAQLRSVIRHSVNETLRTIYGKRALREEYGTEDANYDAIAELSEELGVEPDEIRENNYNVYGNGKSLELEDGREYALYMTSEDAYKAAVEEVTSLIEDEGILPDIELSDFIDANWADELAREEADYYTDEAVESGEIEEDDSEDYWSEQYNRIAEDPAGYLDGIYGRELGEYLVKQNALDIDAIARYCVDVDGVAHSLARYDGNEIELPCGAVAYRLG